MFEDVFRKLNDLEHGTEISVPIELDDDGYYDRLCPNDECGADFKVHFEDWKDKVRDEAVYCPICRFEADSGEWNTPEQQNYFVEAGKQFVQEQLGQAFKTNAARFNRSQPRNSFIKMSMTYQSTPLPPPVRATATDIMTQQSSCEECGCRYSSIGAAFFCPACGHNSAATTFDGAVETVRKTLGALDQIEKTLTEATGKDHAADTVRHMVENSIERLVASFQRFAEAVFDTLSNRSSFTVKKNAFQRLSESSDLWKAAIGIGYDDLLTDVELKDLTRLFQQRHLLAHREGIVDQEYLDKSGDMAYSVGQRLVVSKDKVQRLMDLVSKLSSELRSRT